MQSQSSVVPVFQSVKETATQLGVTRQTISRWTDYGYLKSYKIGGRVLYNREEVLESVYLTSTKGKSYKRAK